jgi:hypothetical protein
MRDMWYASYREESCAGFWLEVKWKKRRSDSEENSNKWIVRDKRICTGEDGMTGNWDVLNSTHVDEWAPLIVEPNLRIP